MIVPHQLIFMILQQQQTGGNDSPTGTVAQFCWTRGSHRPELWLISCRIINGILYQTAAGKWNSLWVNTFYPLFLFNFIKIPLLPLLSLLCRPYHCFSIPLLPLPNVSTRTPTALPHPIHAHLVPVISPRFAVCVVNYESAEAMVNLHRKLSDPILFPVLCLRSRQGRQAFMQNAFSASDKPKLLGGLGC